MKPAPIPEQSVIKRLNNFDEVEIGFSKRVAVDEARKFPQSHLPESQPKCPLGINILEFIRHLREGDVSEAYKKIREQNSLPGICGRLCPAPCEKDFLISGQKVEVEVRALERFVADHGRPKFFGRDKLTCAKKRVAIIGSGPAGLSAAAILARELFCVTVFESLPLLGGVLRYGVPGFRLSPKVLDAEIDQIRDLGVEFKTNMVIGQTVGIDQLFEQGFSAILLAAGKSHPKFIDLSGSDAPGVFYSNELLMRMNFSPDVFQKDFKRQLGDKVVVIGSHRMAFDSARACRRLGKEVSVVFPKTEEDIDIGQSELENIKDEGAVLKPMLKPYQIEVDETGSVKGLRCKSMDFADRNGKWILVPVPDGEVVLQADSIVIAQGCEISPSMKKMLPGLKLNKNGTVWIDEKTGQTSLPNIFATGDLLELNGHVLDAMVSGKRAAGQMMEFLSDG